MSILVRPASLSDVLELAPRLCKNDVLEIEAFSSLHAHVVLQRSFDASAAPLCAVIDGVPSSMWGVVPDADNPRVGCVWMLNSENAASSHSYIYGRGSKRWVQEQLKHYSKLYNYADIANLVSIQWLKWLGFEMKRHHYRNGRTYWYFENKGATA